MASGLGSPAAARGDALVWLHIGDLSRIVALADALPPASLDFAVLPGDSAEDGAAAQYTLLREALAGLRLPLHILPGDHDMKPGNLDAFHWMLGLTPLPQAVRVKGCRCLFLDVVSAGTGSPDFRLGPAQLAWAEQETEEAEAAGEQVVVFMHTYPADLRDGGERLGALLARSSIRCVDMGHTHYNELANDGRTIFMAARSTGQVEEGPPGFSLAAIDGGIVSWRFKPLDHAWPFVLITQPADARLVIGPDQVVDGAFAVRAKVVGDAAVQSVELQVGQGAWAPMAAVQGAVALWEAQAETPDIVRVRVRDVRGRLDQDAIQPAGPGWTAPPRAADGSDRDRIGAWPERGIFDTQFGPNRNGRHW